MFKLMDKVRTRKDLEVGHVYNGVIFFPHMQLELGAISKRHDVKVGVYQVNNAMWYDESMLELVEDLVGYDKLLVVNETPEGFSTSITCDAERFYSIIAVLIKTFAEVKKCTVSEVAIGMVHKHEGETGLKNLGKLAEDFLRFIHSEGVEEKVMQELMKRILGGHYDK